MMREKLVNLFLFLLLPVTALAAFALDEPFIITLATIAVMDPPNLSVLCVDNGHYLETGRQVTHTARGTDLEAMARGAGFKATATVGAEAQIGHGRAVLREPAHCSFVLLRVAPTDPPAFRRDMDAAATRLRMKASLA